jgi:hypothetical protein
MYVTSDFWLQQYHPAQGTIHSSEAANSDKYGPVRVQELAATSLHVVKYVVVPVSGQQYHPEQSGASGQLHPQQQFELLVDAATYPLICLLIIMGSFSSG